MAKRNSMPKARAGRRTSRNSGDRHPTEFYRSAIEAERTRLMKAEAVLGSLAFALKHAEWRCENGTDYANVVEVARDIVVESVARLELVHLERVSGRTA